MKIEDLHGKLFPPKDLYLLSCSERGKLPLLEGKSNHYKRKMQYQNLHLMDCIKYTRLGMPKLKGYSGPTEFTPVYYCERNRYDGKGQFVHFCGDDYSWAHPIWDRTEETIHSLRKFDGMFSPDFTLFCDYDNPDKFTMFNKIQVYKSRMVGAIAESFGYTVIPTATCGDVDSFEYCY